MQDSVKETVRKQQTAKAAPKLEQPPEQYSGTVRVAVLTPDRFRRPWAPGPTPT